MQINSNYHNGRTDGAISLNRTRSHNKVDVYAADEKIAAKLEQEFDDGFAKPELKTANISEKPDSMTQEAWNSLQENMQKAFLAKAEGRNVLSGKILDISVITPTQRIKTAYETSRDFYGTNLDTGEQCQMVTLKYRDTASEIDVPGKFFLNGNSFFDEAAKLYASDHDYLDNNKAWLPKDIARYARDAINFFGGDPSDTSELEKQINNYIRALSNPAANQSDLEKATFTIAGVDFTADAFRNTLDYLHNTLLTAWESAKTESQAKMDTAKANLQIEDYAKENLNDAQYKLLLDSKSRWSTYSEWAHIYAHDGDVFRYI